MLAGMTPSPSRPRPGPRAARHAAALLGVLLAAPCAAAPLRLPPSACDAGRLFAGGFEQGGARSSGGSGGASGGELVRSASAAGLGTRSYYLHVPASYRPGEPTPLLVALHGAAGPGAADAAARAARSDWSQVAEAGGFLVLAPVASGTYGGWVPAADGAWLAAALDDAAAAYSVDLGRRMLWGFSAGAHWGYALVLDNPGSFSGFAASAGVLEAYACDAPGAPSCAALLGAQPWPTPIAIRVGQDDPLRARARSDRGRLHDHGWQEPGTLSYAEPSGGHTYSAVQLAESWQHLCRFALPPD